MSRPPLPGGRAGRAGGPVTGDEQEKLPQEQPQDRAEAGQEGDRIVRRLPVRPASPPLGHQRAPVLMRLRHDDRAELMPFPARINEERRERAAARDIGLAAAILCDAGLLGSLSYRQQLIVARRYLRKDQNWAQIAADLGLTKAQVTSTWRRLMADERVREVISSGQAR